MSNFSESLAQSYVDMGTTHVDGTEDDVFSAVIPADTLANDGDSVRQTEYVNVADSGSVKQIRKCFGRLEYPSYYNYFVAFDTGPGVVAGRYRIDTVITRVALKTARVAVSITPAPVDGFACNQLIDMDLSQGGGGVGIGFDEAIRLATTGLVSGDGAAAGDIVGQLARVTYEPAA